jgi:hypothetical protein
MPENDNPLLQAIRLGDYILAKSILNDVPLLIRVKNTSENTDFRPLKLMLGNSTANMNPLQYALIQEDQGESKILIDLLISVCF